MSDSILNLEIFRWIDKSVIEEIILSIPEREYENWKIILIENAPSNWEWYIIKSGRVKISIKWQKIAELNSWDMVWEISLLNEENRTATVEALEDTVVLVLTLNVLIDMINNDSNSINKEIIRRIEENIGK